MSVKTLFTRRRLRITLALILIGVSVWAFAPFVAYRVSSSAFINSELVRVTAPIPGYLSTDLPNKGDFIEHPFNLPLVKSYAADRRQLLDLERDQTVSQERAEVAEKQFKELVDLDGELAKRMQAYKDGMIERLGHEINEAEAESSGCLAEVQHRRDTGARMEGLAQSGATSQIRSNEALALQEATATKCQMAAARLERLKAELHSVRNGVFLRDATNDVPYSQQQRERLFLRRQELEAEARQEGARAAQLKSEIAEEQDRVAHLGEYSLTLPKDHVVWSIPASPGSVVAEGQAILDLADCDHRFVAVELPEREFEQIKPGDPAFVRLIGSDDWRQGQIRQVRGSAARADDRLLAAQIPTPSRGNITVEVSLTENGPPAGNSSYCDIGRLAEVRFHRTPPAILSAAEKLWRSMAGVLKSEKVAER